MESNAMKWNNNAGVNVYTTMTKKWGVCSYYSPPNRRVNPSIHPKSLFFIYIRLLLYFFTLYVGVVVALTTTKLLTYSLS